MIIHAPVRKPLITEFFPKDDKYLDRDAVFGVRAPLVLPFKKVTDRKKLPANLPAREPRPMPVWTAKLYFKLPTTPCPPLAHPSSPPPNSLPTPSQISPHP